MGKDQKEMLQSVFFFFSITGGGKEAKGKRK